MPTITVRNISAQTKQMLREQAAKNARSMEAEVREIIAKSLHSLEKDREVTPNQKYLDDVESVRGMWAGRFDHLVGIWKGRGTTDEIMEITRGE